MRYRYSDYENVRGGSVRRYLSRLFLALCVIGVGVGYIGNQVSFLPWANFTLFFPGWGALFLIVPSVYFLLRYPWSWFWTLCLGGGILIILSKLDVMPMQKALVIILGVLLILLGLRILLNPLFRRWRMRRMRRRMTKWVSGVSGSDGNVRFSGEDATNYAVSFGSHTYDMAGKSFTSATLSVTFGEMTFDLREALVQDDSVIDANCSFGQLTVLLPEGVRAEITPACSFGNCENRRRKPSGTDTPTVYINVSCSFGDVEVK